MSLANDAQPTDAIAIITVYMPGGKITDTPITRSKDGNARIRSTTTIRAMSTFICC